MRLLVTGREGQVAPSLSGRRRARSRAWTGDRRRPAAARSGCGPRPYSRRSRRRGPDIVVSAAAYTAVDQAEDEPDAGLRGQRRRRRRGGGGRGAAGCAGDPSLHRLCFRRRKDRRLCRDGRDRPAQRLRRAASLRAKRRWRQPIRATSSCARPGSTARSARISSRPCSACRRS